MPDDLPQGNAQHLSAILNNMSNGFITTDRHGCITFLNNRATDLTGWAKTTAYGQPLTKIFSNTATTTPLDQILQNVLQKNDPNTAIDFSYPATNGAIFQGTATPLTDAQSQINGVIFIFDYPPANNQIGILVKQNESTELVATSYLNYLQTFADQTNISLQKAVVFDKIHQHAQHLAILNELAREMTKLLDIKTLCTTVVERIHSAFGYYNIGIFTIEKELDSLLLQALAGEDKYRVKVGHFRVKLGQGIIGQAAALQKTLIINDTSTSQEFYEFQKDLIHSELAIPLIIADRLLGVFNIDSNRRDTFQSDNIAVLTTVADQLTVALENVRLFEAEREARKRAEALQEEARQNLRQTTRLYELSTDFISTLSVEQTALLVVEKIVQATQGHSAVINLIDEDGHLVLTTARDEPPPRPTGTTMTIVKRNQPIAINDTNHEPDLLPPALLEKGFQASIGLPLKVGQNIIGVLFVRHHHPRQFTWREIETLFIFANQAAVALQNARLYEQVQHYTADLENRVEERTFKLQVLLELTQALGQASQYSDIVRQILLHLFQAIPYDMAASLLVGDDLSSPLMIQSQRPLTAALEAQVIEIMCSPLERMRGEVLDHSTFDIHRIPAKTSPTNPPLEDLASLMQALIFIDNIPVGILLVALEAPDQLEIEHANLLRTIADQAAESIQRLRSLLVAEHRRLENLVAHLPDGVILLDRDYRIMLANPVAQKFLQILDVPRVSDKLFNLNGHSIETILSKTLTNVPYEIQTAGPSPEIFEITAQPMSMGPETGGWTLVVRNVTEERNTQKRIRQHEQLAAVGQLAAGIAHDFNNILTSIIGFSELLLADPTISTEAKQDLTRITKQGQRAAHLVSQILDFSRQSIIEKRPLNFISFLKETIRLLERTLPETIKIVLDIETAIPSPMINADLTQVQQGLTNLAINARDAMPNGGDLRFQLRTITIEPSDPTPTPEITAGHWLILTVSDTGVGIPAEIIPHIFEPFFTTKEVGQGTGLGLAQVYGIVRQHGGEIEVQSVVGRGTTFTLYFPISLEHYIPNTPPKALNIPRGQGEVILVVEDDEAVLDVTQAMLERLGYQVLVATEGQAALEIYAHHRSEVALILSDLTMPKMGGIELILALRKQDPMLKFITMTGYPLQGDAKDLLLQGHIEWLQKPITTEKMVQTVYKMLNVYR